MYQKLSGAIQGKKLGPLLHLSVVAIEKGAFAPSLATVANFIYNIKFVMITI